MAPPLGAQQLIGHRLLDIDGNIVGKIGQVYFDDQTDAPKWITVRTGLFGTHEYFVPLRGARAMEEGLQVPFDKDTIKRAPSIDTDRHISPDQEDIVYDHYGMRPEVPEQRAEDAPRGGSGFTVGRHRRPSTDDPHTPRAS
ncbi:PRC-barrel domain-containing protein [Salinactinospora qingdaonensis]|uniref:PRC-barrel domain-containing protein n=1 Tax=Salinactinospora qingdaonensis TaxID=702744 RepID=A0ABP7FZV0_9ACTN